MRNYEKMSDPKINKLVTEQMAWMEPGCTEVTFENHCFWAHATGMHAYPIKDYCNDVSVAWPIIVDNGISLTTEDCSNDWHADVMTCIDENDKGVIMDVKDGCHNYGPNPLRAAMICFLKMKDAEVSE